MMKRILGAGTCAALACTLNAGPINPGDVAAEPGWVVHLDFDKLRSTSLGKSILEELRKPDPDQKLAGFNAFTGVDPRQDLFGATLYSPGTNADQAVVLVYAKFDPERLVNVAKAAREYKSSEYQKHQIHSWLDEKKANQGDPNARVYAAIHGKRVVFGPKESQVQAALDVLDGRSASLAKSKAFPALATPNDSFLRAAARRLPMNEGDPNAAVLRQSKSVSLEAMESGKDAVARLNLEANDAEVAKNMVSIGEGLISLLKLQTGQELPSKLAQALSIQQDGGKVSVSMKMPSTELFSLVKAQMGLK